MQEKDIDLLTRYERIANLMDGKITDLADENISKLSSSPKEMGKIAQPDIIFPETDDHLIMKYNKIEAMLDGNVKLQDIVVEN